MQYIFLRSSNRGVGYNREPGETEYSITTIKPTQAEDFFRTPQRYWWDGYKLVEVDGWSTPQETETLESKIAELQEANKILCRAHIYKKYTLETQLNATGLLYGQDFLDTMNDFKARCIAEEDAAFDAAAACNSLEELAELPAISFPEV